jgi:hypothetical protein
MSLGPLRRHRENGKNWVEWSVRLDGGNFAGLRTLPYCRQPVLKISLLLKDH